MLTCPRRALHTSILWPFWPVALWDAKSWDCLGIGHRQLGNLVNLGYSGGLSAT